MLVEAQPFRTVSDEAFVDTLTGLPNRAALMQELVRQTAEHPGDLGLAFFDLDNFKKTNDMHGHRAGDVLLQTTGTTLTEAVANTLREVMRTNSSDVTQERRGDHWRVDYLGRGVFRYAGDEFVGILAGADTQEKVDAAITRCEAALLEEGIRASIGGRPHRPGESGMDLLDAVDRMMFEKKEARKQQEINDLPLPKRLAYKVGVRAIRFSGVDPPR